VNPALEVLQLEWSNLPAFISAIDNTDGHDPLPVEEIVLVWKNPHDGQVKYRTANSRDLLVLKMVVEGITPKEAAAEGAVAVSIIDAAIDRSIKEGILLSPPSLLRRDPAIISAAAPFDNSFCETDFFTLQWHITQTCDLHCKHCYDRSSRSELEFSKALAILEELHCFCRKRHVKGRISFSGGNPLLYPHFDDLYCSAAEHGFDVSILGNPSPRARLEKIVSIHRPDFFQVSLEGLQEHNDSIRGPGHFERSVRFLELLRELDIYSMVMLTLTRDNIDQVLPLGKLLQGVADTFNFNRLSMVGEGSVLKLPSCERYAAFLEDYLEKAGTNPVLGIKDNLINIIYRQKGVAPFGGCTGFGCGAAFNFLSLLADGEVHACRKFPSPIGNINEQSLTEIYDSAKAQRYRAGCDACSKCPIRPGCGGCLAIAHSHGLDIFKEKDPYCFFTVSE
jgi:selenobiotic family peptide radical SAM maturase